MIDFLHFTSSPDGAEALPASNRGVHGPVIDLFECSDKLYTAVEVTAGNQLFNVVVDTDATASRLYALLSQHKAGRVTCLPINRLNVSAWRPCSWCCGGCRLVPCPSTMVAAIALLSCATAIRSGKALGVVMSQLLYCRLLQPEAARYPTDLQQDALPLIGKLTFHEGFLKPMQQVGPGAMPPLVCQAAAVLHGHRCCP